MTDEDPGGEMRNSHNLSSELERSRRLVLGFCLVELELANAILDHADVARGADRRAESIGRARSVREGLVRILEHFRPTEDEARTVHAGLAQLDRRLAEEDGKGEQPVE